MTEPTVTAAPVTQRRRLRAVFAADVANFGGLVAADETQTMDGVWEIRRIARAALAEHGGWLFGLPGDGIFALFESAVDAVQCGLTIQAGIRQQRSLARLQLRTGIHLGEVLFRDELPFGEALVIAARLESLAEPGSVLVSQSVMEAVAPRMSVTFRDRGSRPLKHSPRHIATYSVELTPVAPAFDAEATSFSDTPLDQTVRFHRPESLDETGPARPAPPLPPPLAAAAQEVLTPARPAPARGPPPAVPDAALPAQQGPAAANAPDLKAVGADLTAALVPHVGPIARVLVNRHTAAATSLADLVDRLAGEIPSPGERRAFQAMARTRWLAG